MKNTKELKKATKRDAFNNKIYLLGQDSDGVNYYLEAPSWDCGRYWGFGYIETYTNNNNPAKAKDIRSHQHFDTLFFKGKKCAYDLFKEFFTRTTLNDNEIWLLLDYMQTFYTLRDSADLFDRGYSSYTDRAKLDTVKNKELVNKINDDLLPALFNKVNNLLSLESK